MEGSGSGGTAARICFKPGSWFHNWDTFVAKRTVFRRITLDGKPPKGDTGDANVRLAVAAVHNRASGERYRARSLYDFHHLAGAATGGDDVFDHVDLLARV